MLNKICGNSYLIIRIFRYFSDLICKGFDIGLLDRIVYVRKKVRCVVIDIPIGIFLKILSINIR